jgi:hypothetical protein
MINALRVSVFDGMRVDGSCVVEATVEAGGGLDDGRARSRFATERAAFCDFDEFAAHARRPARTAEPKV